MEKHFKTIELRIDWSEMDLFGHVNNVSFFKYIQASRVNYWERTGLTQLYANDKKGPLLASTACRFLKPLFYPGKIKIHIEVSFVKNTSFGLIHKIMNEAGELSAEAEDVIVFFDFNKNEKILLTDEIRNKLAD